MARRSKSMGLLAIALLASCFTACYAQSDLYTKWAAQAANRDTINGVERLGAFTDGLGQRYGQICDNWRTADDVNFDINDDVYPGCVAVWLADPSNPGNTFQVGDLPANQQNNFHNTQHYHQAYSLHGMGFKSRSLPRDPQDFTAACYIATTNDNITVLGYEEGNGDVMLPCPGTLGGYPFELDPDNLPSQAELEEMCSMCYTAVCNRNSGDKNPRKCGGTGQGGLQVGQGGNDDDVAQMVRQVNDAYHCHLTMANEGACDYVQWDQHEYSREYNMSSGVLCGWENIKYLNLSYCDCTRVAGTANGCEKAECLAMAANGVICGNCGNNNCDQDRAYDQIFGAAGEVGTDEFTGVCALIQTASDPVVKAEAYQNCSRGLFCRSTNLDSSGCQFHCGQFPDDPHCNPPSPPPPAARRSLLAVTAGSSASEEGERPGADLDIENYEMIRSGPIKQSRRMGMF